MIVPSFSFLGTCCVCCGGKCSDYPFVLPDNSSMVSVSLNQVEGVHGSRAVYKDGAHTCSMCHVVVA